MHLCLCRSTRQQDAQLIFTTQCHRLNPSFSSSPFVSMVESREIAHSGINPRFFTAMDDHVQKMRKTVTGLIEMYYSHASSNR